MPHRTKAFNERYKAIEEFLEWLCSDSPYMVTNLVDGEQHHRASTVLLEYMEEEWHALAYEMMESESWGIFESIGVETALRLEKVDEDNVFETDDEAALFVWRQAREGSGFHRMALSLLERDSTKEYDRIVGLVLNGGTK